MSTSPDQGKTSRVGPFTLAPPPPRVGQDEAAHSSDSGIPAVLPYSDVEHGQNMLDSEWVGCKGERTYSGHFPHIATLTGAGLRLRLDGNRIIASPSGAITAEVRDYITAHRDAIRHELFVRGIAGKLEGVIADLVVSCLDWYRDDYSALQDMSRAELHGAVLAYLGRELWAKEVLPSSNVPTATSGSRPPTASCATHAGRSGKPLSPSMTT